MNARISIRPTTGYHIPFHNLFEKRNLDTFGLISETFKTCRDLVNRNKDVFGSGRLSSVGRYFTIDPDGPFGVDPFTVRCSGRRTIVEVDDGNLSFVFRKS